MANGAAPVIACVGAGRMGRGIAHCFAYAGFEVRLVDAKRRSQADQAALFEQTHEEIRGSLTTVADLGGFDRKLVEQIAGRVSVFSRDYAATALDGVRFVFEAVPEPDEAKRDALTLIDETAGADAIVASATSTYLSTQLS